MTSEEKYATSLERDDRLRKIDIFMDRPPSFATKGGRVALDQYATDVVTLPDYGERYVEVLTDDEKTMLKELVIRDANEAGER